ncbi:hypothetical protein A2U01_0097659 [Trifolium medium]|nr:hypothetical protein [Trifolium medium]
MRAQEEQRAAASASTPAGLGEPMFTYGELGLDDPRAFIISWILLPPVD